MKGINMVLICCMFGIFQAKAQKDFTGLIKYKLTVEGSPESRTDSMFVWIDGMRARLQMFLPGDSAGSPPKEIVYVEDLASGRSLRIDPATKTFVEDSVRMSRVYPFRNTNRYGMVERWLSFVYQAPPDSKSIKSVECQGSIEYMHAAMTDYAFLGYQPVIVDGRLVLDFSITKMDGTKPRVYAYEIQRITNVSQLFNLEGYTKK
ncbi:MAG TPA: hypothetical protein DHV17_09325 [Chitinophagaceae bacterium]|nr:hypothetical protein [Chitinophagaceae bacterium]